MADKRGFGKLFVLILGLLVGFQIGQWLAPSADKDVEKVDQVFELTKKYYLEKIDPDTLAEHAIDGILSKLDPHTVYIPSNVQKSIEEEFEGNFEGIGVEFQIIDDTITIVSPIVGTPSDRLGLMPGDRIVKIEDSSAVGFTNAKVIKKLRGEKGSLVKITIYRPSVDELIDYEIERDVIPINSVEIALMLQDSVGYVSVTRFAEKTFDELSSSLNELKQEGMKYLLLDLRNNPGGYFEQAVEVSDLFISGNKLIVYTKGRIKEFDEERRASESYPYEKIPLIVLINRGSASASEIVSGSIQDWDRGLIVGETSFGKGLVQRPFILSDNSALRLTISKYYTPSGREIQRDYKKSKDYYGDVLKRKEAEGDNFDHHSEADSTKKSYKTSGGRIVYGGGGITPDYNVPLGDLTNFTAQLRSKNLLYQFIRYQIDNDKLKLTNEQKGNLEEFLKAEIITPNKLHEFIQFIQSKNIIFNRTEFNTDKEYIISLLKAYVAKDYFNSKGWYSVLISEDDQVQKSMELLNEAKSMINKTEN